MISCLCFLLAILCAADGSNSSRSDVDVAQKRIFDIFYTGYSPLTTLFIIKFKKVLLALLVLLGTAATTKFIAGIVHFFGYHCRHRPYRPIYLKKVKYESPTYSHIEPYPTYEKPYYESDYHSEYSPFPALLSFISFGHVEIHGLPPLTKAPGTPQEYYFVIMESGSPIE
ncbi:UNVERIFIED_CONTAM: hypothetical protein PYX00_010405 [Menopon gallinae]|uniref:Uncharacterized protein n=1 Tax=Menopon gallinae TaxID=328185 RepID=A0AAW2HFC4_9NEOP